MPPLATNSCPESPSASESQSRHFDSLDKLQTVRFALDQNEVTLIPTLDEFTPDEISKCFYNASDFKKMKSQDRVLLRMLKKGYFSQSPGNTSQDHCLRGIEQEAYWEERLIRIQKVQAIVLSNKRRYTYEEDAVELATKLAKATLFSKQEAISRARGDAAAALEM